MGHDDIQRAASKLFPKVQRIARAFAARLPAQIEFDDLVQIGTVGMMSALRSWDPSRGGSLEAYVEPRIRGAIQDALRADDPLSRDERRDARTVDVAARRFAAQHGRAPEEHELAAAAGLSVERVRALRLKAEALSAPADGEPGEDPVARLEDERQKDALELYELAETRARLIQALEALPERHRLVLSLYYVEELSLKQIGELLEVTESRVCQLHREGLRRMKEVLADA